MTRFDLVSERRERLHVAPHLGALQPTTALRAAIAGEDFAHPMGEPHGDRMDMRRYAPGDPARNIHWKAFSRTRTLMVRTPETALSARQRTAVFLATGKNDAPSAAFARVGVELNAFGEDWMFAASGVPRVTRTAIDAVHAICESGNAHPGETGTGLGALVRVAQQEGPVALVLFAPPSEGAWIGELRELRQHEPWMQIKVCIGVDGVRASSAAARPWGRLFVRPAVLLTADEDELAKCVRLSAQLGAEVVVADRASGRLLQHVAPSNPAHRMVA